MIAITKDTQMNKLCFKENLSPKEEKEAIKIIKSDLICAICFKTVSVILKKESIEKHFFKCRANHKAQKIELTKYISKI